MRKLFVAVIALMIGLAATAQDENLYNHYFINQALYNPAYCGFSGKHGLQLNSRSDWTGFPGSQNSFAANYNGPITQNIGLGATLMSDNVASFNRYRAGLSYSFRFEQGDLKSSIGLNTNFEFYRVQDPTTGNSLYDNGDATINDFANGERYFDAGLGIFLSYTSYYFGFTSPNLVQSRLDDIPLEGESSNALFRYYTFLAGSLYEFGSTGISLEPMIFVRKARNIPMDFSTTLLVGYLEEKVKAGFSYHNANEGSVSFLAGTKWDSFHLFYSFNLSFGKFQRYTSGSHEITVGVSFDSKRSRFRNAY